ncbi:unnamed protein product [Blepharisma stoltei]|uniref:Uncharacterized protein n=1 Tax=Blepharisma stoltei TaxID=1481888 RepID=A0AAU9IY92_9CILI|nr:unnamed protein product [Blepharisma stoltei]
MVYSLWDAHKMKLWFAYYSELAVFFFSRSQSRSRRHQCAQVRFSSSLSLLEASVLSGWAMFFAALLWMN